MNNSIAKHCDFRIHDIIDKKYRVERVLGQTTTDCKFKVVDSQGQEYILKLLKLWQMEPRMQQLMTVRSESEINSCCIKSNYLTQIVHRGVVNGNPYLLTKYCQSTDLAHLINNPRLDRIRILKHILYGLRDLHKQGKVHCNLTPENILVTAQGDALLTNYIILGDRGKALAEQKRLHQVNKAFAYMAPERYRLEKCATVLPTIDLFAFGVIAYQLVTGELPFGRLNTEADWMNYQSRALIGDWKKGTLTRGEENGKWVKLFEACLHPSSQERVQTVDEVLALLPDCTDIYEPVADATPDYQKTVMNGILLRIMQGEEYGKIYRLNEMINGNRRILTVGRQDASIFNVIVIKEATSTYVSRRHCTLELDDETGTWYIRDGQWDKDAKTKWVRSLNGTFLNSQEVNDEGDKITPGDIISIGDVKLRVEGY